MLDRVWDYLTLLLHGSWVSVAIYCALFCQENTPDAERTMMIRENIYVRVYGHVRSFAGKRSIVAFRIYPLADMNELTAHMLEVIFAHAYLVRVGTPMVLLLCFPLSVHVYECCLLYTSPSPRDRTRSRMPSSA